MDLAREGRTYEFNRSPRLANSEFKTRELYRLQRSRRDGANAKELNASKFLGDSLIRV